MPFIIIRFILTFILVIATEIIPNIFIFSVTHSLGVGLSEKGLESSSHAGLVCVGNTPLNGFADCAGFLTTFSFYVSFVLYNDDIMLCESINGELSVDSSSANAGQYNAFNT